MYHAMQDEACGQSFDVLYGLGRVISNNKRPRPDTQNKLVYADAQSFYLAQWLKSMEPESPVCLIGYSLGARIIGGALHMMAGGELAGRKLSAYSAETSKGYTKADASYVVGPAMDSDWLISGHRNGLALSQVDRMFITQKRL